VKFRDRSGNTCERQRTAEALAREINLMGAWVVSPSPPDANAKLRFQVLDRDRQKVLVTGTLRNGTENNP